MDQIAEFVVDTGFENIPDETVSFTKHLASKIVAAMLTGSTTLAGRKVAEYVKSRRVRWTHLSRQFLEIFKLHFGA